MKCKQKLCSRNKNIEASGNCSVCENVLVESAKAFEDKKKKVSTKVEVDLDLMVKVHDKLSRGIAVEQEVVGNLLLGGVINILHQHDVIKELDNRIKDVEQTSLTDRLRFESLEN